MLLFHYTTFSALQGIVESRQLHCTNIRYLNDAWEWEYLQRHVNDAMARKVNDGHASNRSSKKKPDHKIWQHLLKNPSQYPHAKAVHSCVLKLWKPDGQERQTFCFSLSKRDDWLSQWRGYADGAHGVCIGFDCDEFQKHHDIQEVEYNFPHNERMIHDLFGDLATVSDRTTEIVAEFRKRQAVHKWHQFAEEAEWRLVVKRDAGGGQDSSGASEVMYRVTPRGMVPYVAISLDLNAIKCLRLGPLVNFQHVKPVVEEFLKKLNVPVEKSSIPLRW